MHDRSTRALGTVAHKGRRAGSGDLRGASVRIDHGLLVDGMRPRLIGGNEPGSRRGHRPYLYPVPRECGPVATRPQRAPVHPGRRAPTRAGVSAEPAPDMPARFNALNDDNVATGISSGPGLPAGNRPASKPAPRSDERVPPARGRRSAQKKSASRTRAAAASTTSRSISWSGNWPPAPPRPCRHCGQNFVESGSGFAARAVILPTPPASATATWRERR